MSLHPVLADYVDQVARAAADRRLPEAAVAPILAGVKEHLARQARRMAGQQPLDDRMAAAVVRGLPPAEVWVTGTLPRRHRLIRAVLRLLLLLGPLLLMAVLLTWWGWR